MTRVSEVLQKPLRIQLMSAMVGVIVLLGLGIYTVAVPQRYQVSSTLIVLKDQKIPSTNKDLVAVRRYMRKLTANYRVNSTIQNSLSIQSKRLSYIPDLALFIPSNSPLIEFTLTVRNPEDAQQFAPEVRQSITNYLESCSPSISTRAITGETISVKPSSDKKGLWIADIAIALLSAGAVYSVSRRIGRI